MPASRVFWVLSDMRTVILLVASNLFMTLAWYGHLKFRDKPLLLTILVSWLIALPEYALQVPANRWGYGTFTATQLKIMQEAISLGVFLLFVWWYLGETPNWRGGVAMLLVFAAVALSQSGRSSAHQNHLSAPTAKIETDLPSK